MNDANKSHELSEAENIEFNRRVDIAYAVVHAAVRLLEERKQIDEQIKDESGALNSYWRWGVFVVALLIHYFVLDGGNSFTWASWIALMAAASWYAKQYEISRSHSRREHLNQKLFELETTWHGATAFQTFWEIETFIKENGFDNHDEVFRAWWDEKMVWILTTIRDRHKGQRIGAEAARGIAQREAVLRKFRGEDDDPAP